MKVLRGAGKVVVVAAAVFGAYSAYGLVAPRFKRNTVEPSSAPGAANRTDPTND